MTFCCSSGMLVEIYYLGCVCFKRLCHLQGGQGPSGLPGDKGIAGEPVSISSSETRHNYYKISDFVALHFRFSHAEFSRYRIP